MAETISKNMDWFGYLLIIVFVFLLISLVLSLILGK